MRTVSDFISARASLRVVCSNCQHVAYFKARFLKERIGLYSNVLKARYVCVKCKSHNVRLAAASFEAVETKLRRMEHFSGVYEKYED